MLEEAEGPILQKLQGQPTQNWLLYPTPTSIYGYEHEAPALNEKGEIFCSGPSLGYDHYAIHCGGQDKQGHDNSAT